MRKLIFLIFLIFTVSCATTEPQKSSEKPDKSTNFGEQYYAEAVAYYETANYELAKRSFLKSLNSKYNEVNCYYFLGIISYSQRNLSDAENYLKKSLELDNKIFDAHNTLGVIYSEQKRYNEAIKEFEFILKDSSYIFVEDALYNIAMTYNSMNDYDKSIEYCNKCLYYVPKSPAVFYLLGVNYFKKGQIDTSKLYFRDIIRNFSGNVWGEKAKLFMKQNRLGN